MSTAHKVLAVIPARGGSKGLPGKNIAVLGGKPLIAWTIEAAQNAKCITRTILSSDDDEIIRTANRIGCEAPFRRPPELATDHATTVDVVLHALSQIPGFDFVIVLQPTSPFRTSNDIDAAFKMMIGTSADSCVSVCESAETPYWMYGLGQDGTLTRLLKPAREASRRQDLPTAYVLNGAIYMTRCSCLLQHGQLVTHETLGYEMPRNRSLDIDTPQDLREAEKSMENNS